MLHSQHCFFYLYTPPPPLPTHTHIHTHNQGSGFPPLMTASHLTCTICSHSNFSDFPPVCPPPFPVAVLLSYARKVHQRSNTDVNRGHSHARSGISHCSSVAGFACSLHLFSRRGCHGDIHSGADGSDRAALHTYTQT